MHYTEVRNGVQTTIPERIEALCRDVEELLLPDALANAHQVSQYIRDSQVISNNVRRVRDLVGDQALHWKRWVDRIQRAIGGSDQLKATELRRKDLKSVATSAWGPVDPKNLTGPQGIKRAILPMEFEVAAQLQPFLAPDIEDLNKVPRVQLSYEDYLSATEQDRDKLDTLITVLEARHFDVNNTVRILEVENYGQRYATKA